VSGDGTGAWWDFDTTLMPAADVTLYAQWRQDDAPPAPSQNTGGETASPGGPKTGDETNMALWIVLMIAAAGVIAGVMVYRYRKSKIRTRRHVQIKNYRIAARQTRAAIRYSSLSIQNYQSIKSV